MYTSNKQCEPKIKKKGLDCQKRKINLSNVNYINNNTIVNLSTINKRKTRCTIKKGKEKKWKKS